MQSLRIFHLFIVVALCCSSFTLYGATRTLDEINAEQKKKEEEKKAAEEAKKKEMTTPKAVQEKQINKNKQQTETTASHQTQTATKTYAFAEEVIGLQKPFKIDKIDNRALMNADPKSVELFEAVSKKENNKQILTNPGEIINLWNQLAEITENNPFIKIAKSRLSEWKSIIDVLNKHQENIDKISKLIPSNIIKADQKASLISQHLDEFGVMFGTEEILNIAKNSKAAEKIAKDENFKTKIKRTIIARCEKKSGKDCFSNGKYFAASEDEKNAYFSKACELKYKHGCEEINRIKAAAEAEKARIAAEEKRKIDEAKRKAEEEKNRQIKEELNKAGRKQRLKIATSTFVSGVVTTVLGGISFNGMNKAEKDRKKYYEEYLLSEYGPETDHLRKKSENADKKRKTFMALGIIGVGAGVALIATGITFYSIDFDGEKEVKKKYNISIGTNPADGTLQLALRW